MALIIDGYNLLHASGILGRGVGPGGLERSRQALLNFLAESLEERDLPATTVVFDAREAPPGLPRQTQFRGLTVIFADPTGDADEKIEELIRANTNPHKLTVVSSDHRLHRAARRRKAKPIDSDQWYAATLRARFTRLKQKSAGGVRRTEPASEAEVQFWLRQFGVEDSQPTSEPPAENPSIDNPFPPGYAEDIGEENE